MNTAITATCAEELRNVTGRIHDCWFSVNDIEHDGSSRELSIRFSDDPALDRRARDSLGDFSPVGNLLIRHVSSYQLTDREQIVWYDFNRLRYREREGTLDVITNIPLGLRLRVDSLEVHVIDT